MKIVVHGGGYVGLAAAVALADRGNSVLLVEVDPARAGALAGGRSAIAEPGVEELLGRVLTSGALLVTSDPAEGARWGELQFVAVGTPARGDGSTDESQLQAVATAIGATADSSVTLVLKSTAPAAALERALATVRAAFAARGVAHAVHGVVNPEFLRTGHALEDFCTPDRVVLGGEPGAALEAVAAVYLGFVPAERVMRMSAASAALVKYAANSMLAVRVSFMNELAALATAQGADIESVRAGVGADPRIGAAHLSAGLGYGGSCLPKDVASLVAEGRAAGVTLGVVAAAAAANDAQPHRVAALLREVVGDLRGKVVGVWGLAFKGGTDDLRDAPSAVVIRDLLNAGAMVSAYDPAAGDAARALYAGVDGVRVVDAALDAARGADALVIAADWPEFRSVDLTTLRGALADAVVVDGRNLLDPAAARAAGLTYVGIGR